MTTQWDKRYSTEEYVYGTDPNQFFRDELSLLSPGKILFLGEGEGRNSVFAATQGWEVDAVDSSSVGRDKALKLAQQKAVSINYVVSDLSDYTFEANKYDAVVLIFLHFPEELRGKIHASAIDSLKSGGVVILESFEKEQIKNNSGGPKNEALLYSLEDIYNDFHALDIDKFSKEIVDISEGGLHKGEAAVIRFVGKKPYPQF